MSPQSYHHVRIDSLHVSLTRCEHTSAPMLHARPAPPDVARFLQTFRRSRQVHARAHVRHELEDAAAARERQRREEQAQQQAAAARAQYAQELALLEKQDVSLAASEADLSVRLWEVQEMRRRHGAMAAQLREAIAALGED